MNSEKGQTFPLALIALAVGSLVISPFLGHASSMLTGSRIYGQAISEQYSCDAGIEWALWKLKGNPELTTNTSYDAAPLEPIPSEINNSSFPTTEIKFVEGGEDSKIETVEWETTGQGWDDHPLYMPGPGTLDLLIETEAEFVKVKLLGDKPKEYNLFFPPFELELQIGSAGFYIIQVETPNFTGLVSMTITTTYPAAIYDIRAQKDNSIITAQAKASYLGVGVISWQVE
jgi:hypothetical protein